jgi:tetratricopeptide (TPR) repeat protein
LIGLLVLTAWNFTRSGALAEAAAAEARGDFVTAIRGAMEHLGRRPWSRDADRVVARCLSRLDFADQAEPYYRWARTLSHEDLHYHAYGLVRANQRERAIKAYDEILKQHPNDVAALRLQAGVYISQSRWDEAKSVARRLTALPPGPATVYTPATVGAHWTLRTTQVGSPPVIGYTIQGMVNHDINDAELAVEAFEHVVELDPELRSMPLQHSMFWSYLGDDLVSAGRSRDAIRYLRPPAEGAKDAGLWDVLGQAYLQESVFDQAEECWRKALELDPKFFRAWLNLGRIELKREHPEEAERLLSQAAKLKPGSYQAAYSLTLTYRRLGRAEEARRWEETADRLRTEGPEQPSAMGMGGARK